MTKDEIKQWCKAYNVTQAELAIRAKFSPGTVRTALSSAKPLTERMHDGLVDAMSLLENPISCRIDQASYEALLAKAESLKKTLDELVEMIIQSAQKNISPEKKSSEYDDGNEYGDLEAAEEGEGGKLE